MRLGLVLRNMGPVSTPEILRACAQGAEAAGIDDLWVTDHVAVPPDEAEGSGGRYLDPLATLSWVAAVTSRIGLGTSVLILPYRPPLPTAKWLATIQELSGGRLRLGVGVGWMEAEFRALRVDRARRGELADETLGFLARCFADDLVEANGQRFLFLPRPARPPILVGGAAPHALERALRLGDGWIPMGADPERLAAPVAELRRRFEAAGRPPPQVVALGSLPLGEPARTAELLAHLSRIGVTEIVHGERYADASGFLRAAEALAALRPRV